MNEILALIQFLLIAYILVGEVKRKSPSMFLWAALFLMFGIMHFIDAAAGTSGYTEKVMINASLFVIGFCILYICTRFVLSSCFCSKLDDLFHNISTNEYFFRRGNIILLVMFVVCSVMIIVSIIADTGSIWNTSWGGIRINASNRSYFSGYQIWTIGYNTLGGLLCCFIIKKSKIGFIISFFCMLFVELITRNRVLVLPLLICFISVYVFRVKKIRFNSIILGAFSAIFVIYIIYAIRAFRFMGDLGTAIGNFNFSELNNQIKEFLVTSDGELGLKNWMYYFIEKNNQFVDFGKGHTYLRMLLVYIPTRFSLGLKPNDFAISMGTAIGMQAGGSMHPTLFGDCYANLGNAGILLGIAWGMIMHFQDVLIVKLKYPNLQILAFVLMGTANVVMGRGAVYNGFFNIAWGIPFLIVIGCLQANLPNVVIKSKCSSRVVLKQGIICLKNNIRD